MNTDIAYLVGLVVGGGVFHNRVLQIVLPYQKWGNLNINPTRAGVIARDILTRLNPILQAHYGMSVSFSVGNTDWNIQAQNVPDAFLDELRAAGLPVVGELRNHANLNALMPLLTTTEHKRRFISGLTDTIGSLALTHRRFVNDFQVISFEFKGKNFELVSNVVALLQDIGCTPDQVLWNHPNQHASKCRYYKAWKKGFKVRVALDDYMLRGSFVFTSKQSSAKANQTIQQGVGNTTQDKPIKVHSRVTLHKDENSDWLPPAVRGGHFIHNLHFFGVFGLSIPASFDLPGILSSFENYFCPFTCLSKGTIDEVNEYIASDDYLVKSTYRTVNLDLPGLLALAADKGRSALVFGATEDDGFPISLVLQAVAYVVLADRQESIKGKRVLGKYEDHLERLRCMHVSFDIHVPDRGTCLMITGAAHAALVGYVNNDFNRKLITSTHGGKVCIREPKFSECIVL